MRFVEVDKVPETTLCGRPRNDIRAKLKKFMEMNARIVKVEIDEGEYASVQSVYIAIRRCVDTHELPIIVSNIQDVVYLIRTDI